MIPLDVSNPSISASKAFNVCSRSSFPPPCIPLSRLLPIASISSIKIIHGAICCACLNKSRTLDAPTPTKSDPESEKNGTPASPATALASNVLPVPGGPTSNAPFGSFAPISVYRSGWWRKSTISVSVSFASPCPATSANVTPVFFSTYTFALDFPTPIIPLLLRIIMTRNPKITIVGIKLINIDKKVSIGSSGSCSNAILLLIRRFTSS